LARKQYVGPVASLRSHGARDLTIPADQFIFNYNDALRI
jgi:hypothetical protein